MKKLIAVTVITIMLFTMSAGAIDLVATEDYHIDDEKEFSVTMYTPVQDAKKTRYERATYTFRYVALSYTMTIIRRIRLEPTNQLPSFRFPLFQPPPIRLPSICFPFARWFQQSAQLPSHPSVQPAQPTRRN